MALDATRYEGAFPRFVPEQLIPHIFALAGWIISKK
jgi:hypothetical protein